jgi:hypothetical protein
MVREVVITASGAIRYDGNERLATDATVPTESKPGPKWTFELADNVYIFNVDITGLGGQTAKFAFEGATPKSDTSMVIPGQIGAGKIINRDIRFTVP